MNAFGMLQDMETLALKMERHRLTSADWERAALDLIAEGGIQAVAVEPLAKRLGVTKGSFYWHFPTRETLLAGALKRWSEDETGDVLRRVQAVSDPRERLRTLFRLTSRTVRLHTIYSALLKSVDHPTVGPIIEKIAEQRVRFLAQLFQDAGLDARAANHRARLAFAAYIGFLQMHQQMKMPKLRSGEFDEYVEHVIETLTPN